MDTGGKTSKTTWLSWLYWKQNTILTLQDEWAERLISSWEMRYFPGPDFSVLVCRRFLLLAMNWVPKDKESSQLAAVRQTCQNSQLLQNHISSQLLTSLTTTSICTKFVLKEFTFQNLVDRTSKSCQLKEKKLDCLACQQWTCPWRAEALDQRMHMCISDVT